MALEPGQYQDSGCRGLCHWLRNRVDFWTAPAASVAPDPDTFARHETSIAEALAKPTSSAQSLMIAMGMRSQRSTEMSSVGDGLFMPGAEDAQCDLYCHVQETRGARKAPGMKKRSSNRPSKTERPTRAHRVPFRPEERGPPAPVADIRDQYKAAHEQANCRRFVELNWSLFRTELDQNTDRPRHPHLTRHPYCPQVPHGRHWAVVAGRRGHSPRNSLERHWSSTGSK